MPRIRHIDMTGKRLGSLTILAREGSEGTGEALWRWRCDCGKEGVSRSTNLRRPRGGTQSCGCKNPAIGGRKIDMTGLWYGRWYIIAPVSDRRAYYHCRCECGTEREVYGPSLRSGASQSCGRGCTANTMT